MHEAGRIVAQSLKLMSEMIAPGVRTADLDREAERYILAQGARPAFKGYHGFPAATCISVNQEVVHGIPSDRELTEGDIVGCDVGVELKGYYADAAETYPVGTVGPDAQRLIETARRALSRGIEQCRPGNRLSDISHAIQATAEVAGFSVVRRFVGHGIGREMHEALQIPNYGSPGRGPKLEPGMTLAIEPMVNAGGYDVDVLADKWTVVTKDGSLSAHSEHTVAVTENAPLVLTGP